MCVPCISVFLWESKKTVEFYIWLAVKKKIRCKKPKTKPEQDIVCQFHPSGVHNSTKPGT